MENPFNPSFGSKPDRFLGRDLIKHEIIKAIDNPNSPWRSTIISGIRGTGKTSMLTDIQESLRNKEKVITVSLSLNTEFLDDLLGEIYRQLPKNIATILKKISGFSVQLPQDFRVGLTLKNDEPLFTQTFRYQFKTMLEELKKHEIRLVILIDEIQKKSEQMQVFVSTYQLLIREKFQINLIMAGLPHAISEILNDKALTFLRRANQIVLKNVDTALVRMDFREVFSQTNFQISETLLQEAADKSYGYPYLIQLIGYFLWNYAEKKETDHLLEKTMVQSKVYLFQNVHTLIFEALSATDKKFLLAMLDDTDDSAVADVSKRMGRTNNYISRYRSRLIASGLVKVTSFGKLAYELPYMKEYLNSIYTKE